MTDTTSYVYGGNRSTVLRRMLDLGLNVTHILPVTGSWLEREAPGFVIPFTTVSSKSEAYEALQHLGFDIFVSTGFPYILPISKLRQHHPAAKFVNIHPSYLPNLRGADPIPGAILFRKDSGVTCHLMDDGIDTGPIICQEKIHYFDGLDAKLLYHLCFRLEPRIFEQALKFDFKPFSEHTNALPDATYYSFKEMDSHFNQNDNDAELIARIRAFNTPRKGFQFTLNGLVFRAFEGMLIMDKRILNLFDYAQYNEIVSIFEDAILVMRDNCLIRISSVEPRPTENLVGSMLGI